MVVPAPSASPVQATETNTETTVIDVTEYGADPSGKHDSTAAVIAALEKAKEIEGHKTLSFPRENIVLMKITLQNVCIIPPTPPVEVFRKRKFPFYWKMYMI